MRLRNVLGALALGAAVSFAGSVEAREVREPRAHLAVDVPDSWAVETEGDWVKTFPEDRTFHLRIKGIEHGGWQEHEAEERAKVFLLEHFGDITIETHARHINYNGFEGHELFGRGIGRDGTRRKFFALILRDKANPRKGAVALGIGTHEGYDRHNRGIYEALRTLRTFNDTKEIRESRAHVALDVPGSWVVDQEGDYARAFPQDRSFHLRVKGIEHGGWQEREAEDRVKIFVLEHFSDISVDTHARRVLYHGFEGHEVLGHGTGRDGVPRKFFAIALRNIDNPRKGVVVLGMGTPEGYD